MKKEFIAPLILILILLILSIKVSIKPILQTTHTIEKVRIDSVYTKLKYDVMPENVWGYTTKYGQITTNNIQKYKVGDSIEIEVISKIK